MARKRIVKSGASGVNQKKKRAAVRRYINLPRMNPDLPYSDGILVGETLYIAGRVGLDPVTGQTPSDVDDEIRLMLESFQRVLRQVGMGPDDVVWVQVFSADLSLWERFNSAYRRIFGKDFPSRTFTGAQLLAGLRFEMNGVAVRN